MTDLCSSWSYYEITQSGYLGKMQSRYLSVFTKSIKPLTHKEASDIVRQEYGIKVPERNGRISELTDMGFLEKVDTKRCSETNKIVNRWKWTGRTKPFPTRTVTAKCPHCGGCGEVERTEYYDPIDKMQERFDFAA